MYAVHLLLPSPESNLLFHKGSPVQPRELTRAGFTLFSNCQAPGVKEKMALCFHCSLSEWDWGWLKILGLRWIPRWCST